MIVVRADSEGYPHVPFACCLTKKMLSHYIDVLRYIQIYNNTSINVVILSYLDLEILYSLTSLGLR